MGKKPPIAVRSPAASADQFVASVGKRAKDVKASKTPGRSDVQASNTTIRTRSDGSVVKRCSIYFPLEVKKALAMHAVETDRDESDIATEAVCALLGIRYPGR